MWLEIEQKAHRLGGSNRAEMCTLLACRPNSFDGVGGLNIKGGTNVLVGLNVLGGCNIICSANVLSGLGIPDRLNLRNNFDVLDGCEVLVLRYSTMVLGYMTSFSQMG